MIIYYFAVVLLFLFALVFRNFFSSEKARRLETNACFFVLFMLAALRSVEVGSDTLHYLADIDYLASLTWNSFFQIAWISDQEIGYLTLAKLFTSINNNPHFFIFWTSAASLIPVIWFIKRHSAYPAVSCAIYVFSTDYLFALGIVRHSIALGIVLIAYDIIIREPKGWAIKASIVCILAMLIHKSAVIGMVVVLGHLFVKKVDYKFYAAGFIAIFLFFVFRSRIHSFITMIHLGKSESLGELDVGLGRTLISLTMVIFVLVFKNSKTKEIDANYSFWEMLVFFSFCLKIMSYDYELLSRAANFCSISYTLCVPSVMKSETSLGKVIILFVFIASFALLFGLFFDPQYTYVFWE